MPTNKQNLEPIPEGYDVFFQSLKQRIREAQVRAALSVLITHSIVVGTALSLIPTLLTYISVILTQICHSLTLPFSRLYIFMASSLTRMP